MIQFYKNDKQLIKKAVKGHRNAQRQLYEKFAPKMLSICRQYIKDLQFAEDVMIAGFMKVFTNLKHYRFEGSFEGWMRKIMVNESISFLRKQKTQPFSVQIDDYTLELSINDNTEFETEQIQQFIDSLPNGYKMVFVLYVVEGYKHKEIAKMLDISESTSKTQLFKAKKMLQQKVIKQNNRNYGATKV